MGNLTFGKYEKVVLLHLYVISILGMILLAVGWVVEVAVICRDSIE